MSIGGQDINQLKRKIDECAAKIPKEAQAFHRRLEALAEKISASAGFGGRDAAKVEEIVREALDLEGDVPAIEKLVSVVRSTRADVNRLRSSDCPDSKTQAMVNEWSTDWLTLIDFVVAQVADRRQALPATSQVQQISIWAEDRRHALPLLENMKKLAESNFREPAILASSTETLRVWMDDFAHERTNAAWLEKADHLLKDLLASNARSAAKHKLASLAQPKEPEVVTQSEPPPVIASLPQNEIPEELPVEERASPVKIPPIARALAECSDLAEALGEDRAFARALDARLSQFRGQKTIAVAEIEALERDVQKYRQDLQDRAQEVVAGHLERLKFRWQWFKKVYGSRDEIEATLKQVDAGKANAAARLRDYNLLTQRTEKAMNDIVNSNRLLLANFLNEGINACLERTNAIGSNPRSIKVDAVFANIRSRIPERATPQVSAESLFERLELRHKLETQLAQVEEDSRVENEKVDTKILSLKRLAEQLSAVSADEDIGGIASRIPEHPPSNRFLDDSEADLSRIEQVLNGRLAKVRAEGTALLLEQRRNNRDWIRVLLLLNPEVEKFAATTPPPEDLEALRTAIDLEKHHSRSISAVAVEAMQRLRDKRDLVIKKLQEHLSAAGFDAHQERDTAQAVLSDLKALTPLQEPPDRYEIDQHYQLVAEAEDSIERIESAHRKIPNRLAELQERVTKLHVLNGMVYRVPLANRLTSIMKGVNVGIQREQWTYLDDQLDEANEIFDALQRDAIRLIGNDTTRLVGRLQHVVKTSGDEMLKQQIESALKALSSQGDLDTPSYSMRRRLQGFLDRKTMVARK